MAPKYIEIGGFKQKARLYSFVFFGRLSVFITLFLMLSFIAQPIDQALAQTEETESPVAADVEPQDEAEEESEEAIEEEFSEENNLSEIEDEEEEEDPADVLDLADLADETVATEEDETSEDLQFEEEVATTTVDGTGVEADQEEETNTPTLDDPEEDEAKTLEEIQAEVLEELEEREDTIREVESLTTDENFFQFNRQSCIAVGNGSYHCTVNDAPALDDSTVVYSDRGENGAKQIFLKTASGGVKQLTNDLYDNTAPYYNSEARQIVWQRQIDGRYQVILYEIDEDEERQLTFSRTNNMEPKVSEDGIVWQAWDGNDWEIMLFDGTYTDQITDNDIQDVAPTIEDGYVLWSVLGTESSEAKVYSVDSKEILTITGEDGAVIANPRFVLVYDTKFDNGDVITQGFDPVTGESTPLGAKAAPEPIDIPDVDPLGEVRALINSKAQQEDDLDIALNPDTASSSDTIQINKASSTEPVLDLSLPDEAEEIDLDLEVEDNDFELTDFDLIVTLEDLDAIPEEEPEEPLWEMVVEEDVDASTQE